METFQNNKASPLIQLPDELFFLYAIPLQVLVSRRTEA